MMRESLLNYPTLSGRLMFPLESMEIVDPVYYVTPSLIMSLDLMKAAQ
jgi:hypothetical protein